MTDRPTVLRGRFATARIHLPLHLISTGTYLLAVIIALVFSELLVTDYALVVVSLGIVVIATVIAFTLSRGAHPAAEARWRVVPLLIFVAFTLVSAGTGGSESVFVSLLVLPTLQIASWKGRRWIIVAVLGACAAVLLSSALAGRAPSGLVEWLQALLLPLVLTGPATIINAFTGQVRRQIAAIRALAEERVAMLDEAVATAAELTRHADRLLAADQFTRGVLDAVTEQSVIGTNLDGLIDVWNPGAERLLRLSPHATQGHRFMQDFHDSSELAEHAEKLGLDDGYAALIETARRGTAEVRDWTYRRDDGTTAPVRVAVTPRLDRDGKTIGFIFVATDITEQLAAARLQDEFVSLISHELRTPLSSILGYLELLREDDDHPLSDEQLSYFTVVERNANRLLHLVGDLLFTAQVESGRLSLVKREMDFSSVVAASVESATPLAAGVGVAFRSSLPTEPVLLEGDPLRLAQVADNLISNAVKFTPRGGTVTVTVSRSEQGVRMLVKDTGVGISEQDLERLYERFFRASSAVRNAVPGIGLGLLITKAIVEGHGGRLDVSSEEGVGTEFCVTLPSAPVPSSTGRRLTP